MENMDLLRAMREMMAEMGAQMVPNMKTGQEETKANQARMVESLKGEMRLTVSAIEVNMKAAVNSIRSELDEKIE
jgi:ribosomal protein L1